MTRNLLTLALFATIAVGCQQQPRTAATAPKAAPALRVGAVVATPYFPTIRGNPVADIRRFGAVADDANSDRAAINAAIASLGVKGGIVDMPVGEFVIDPSGTGTYITLSSNVTLRGQGAGTRLKIKNSNGHFETMFGGASGLANVTLENFTIDMNPTGNSVAFTATTGQRQTGVSLSNTTGFRMRNVRFDPYCGVWAVTVGGSTASDTALVNNYYRFFPKTGTTAVDNSAVYLNGNGSVCSNSSFETALGSGAHGAIELHSGSGTATGNRIDAFRDSINLVTTDTGTAPAYTGHVVTGNSITRVAFGPRVWPLTGYTARGVNISNNFVGLSQATHGIATCMGAGVWWDPTCTGPVEGLTLNGNTIICEDEGAGRAVASEFLNVGISVTPQANTATGVTAVGNTIIRAPGTGIRLSGFDANSHLKSARISNNVIVDAGQNAGITNGAFRTAINYQSNMTDVVVENNTITDTGASALKGVNAMIYYSGLGALTRLTVRNNPVGTASGINLPLTGLNQSGLSTGDGVSADRGDANVTLVWGVDAPFQRFATPLTANRTVTISTTNAVNGAMFRVFRTDTAAFTLNVNSVKTIPSTTPAWVDVKYNGSAWILVGYGTL